MTSTVRGNGCRSWMLAIAALSLLLTNAFPPDGVFRAQAAEPLITSTHDHPFALVALASVDRVRARAASLAESLGKPELVEKLLLAQLDGEDEFKTLFDSPGLDPTRPFGVMSYPEWTAEDGEVAALDLPDMDIDASLASNLIEFLASLAVEDGTFVICLPVKDRDQLMATVAEALEERLVPVSGRTGWYECEKDNDIHVGFVGGYLLVVASDNVSKQWDRNYPDFEKLAKASLGKNGFVYSLFKRGLPKVIRENAADALKLSFAATLQRQDDESAFAFRWRTMFGAIQTELLDLLLSHVDEFRIAGHVDSATHQLTVETELVGPKDGKLTRFSHGLVGKANHFAPLGEDEVPITATASCSLNQKLWKPLVDALYSLAKGKAVPEEAEVVRTLARTVEAGQLDLQLMSPNWRDGLAALRVSGTPHFAEAFNATLAALAAKPGILATGAKPSEDAVDGWPIHRFPASVFRDPAFFGLDEIASSPKPRAAQIVLQLDNVIELKSVTVDTPRVVAIERVERADLLVAGIAELIDESVEVKHTIWLTATPNTVWIGWTSSRHNEDDCPTWFKSAIEAHLATSGSARATNRGNAFFRLMLRGLGASAPEAELAESHDPKSGVRQAAAVAEPSEAEQKVQQEERERSNILRDHPNVVRCEVRPTATGLKASVTFDEAYFLWYATLLQHSLENAQPPDGDEPAEPATIVK